MQINQMPKVVTVSNLRYGYKSIADEVRDGEVLLTHNGQAAAVIVSIDRWNQLVAIVKGKEGVNESTG